MKTYFTSESITEGHPDKVCDQIADSILDALLQQDPLSRCACECTVEPGAVHIMGEITTKAKVDYEAVARKTIAKIGYTKPEYGFDSESCKITCSLHKQSDDIALGVDLDGAGDQGMMFGFAKDDTPELMPLPIALANDLSIELSKLRRNGTIPYLRPDGKTQITVEYDDGKPSRIDTVVVSTQHDPNISTEQLRKDIKEKLILKVLSPAMIDDQTKFHINPTGRFILGGPAADTGLTGRKIIADTYGGYGRHGGGAFSGKDSTKVDRSAAYIARNIAKTIVASGVAKQCEVQLSYAIGVVQPVSIYVDTFGTCDLSRKTLRDWVIANYDLSPKGIINTLGLRKPIFADTAAYGHFGRKDIQFPWEIVSPDRIKSLKEL